MARAKRDAKEDNPFSFQSFATSMETTPFPEVATAGGAGTAGATTGKKKKAAATANGAAVQTDNPFSFVRYAAGETLSDGTVLPAPPLVRPVGARRNSDSEEEGEDSDGIFTYRPKAAAATKAPIAAAVPVRAPAASKKRPISADTSGLGPPPPPPSSLDNEPPPPPPPQARAPRASTSNKYKDDVVPFPDQEEDGFDDDDDDDDHGRRELPTSRRGKTVTRKSDDDDGFSDDDDDDDDDSSSFGRASKRRDKVPPPPPPMALPVPASSSRRADAPGSSPVDSATVDTLRRKLEKERALRLAVEARLHETERSYSDLRQKDADETKALEQAVRTVEQALATANQRALTAEAQASKLQKELTLVYSQLAEARRQAQLAQMQAQAANAAAASAAAAQMPGVGPPLGSDPAIYADVQAAMHALDKITKDARESIRLLMNGASQAEALALILQNLGRLTDVDKHPLK